MLSQIGSVFLVVIEEELEASTRRKTMDDSLISKLFLRISFTTSSSLAPAASMFLYFATVSAEDTAALLCVHPMVCSTVVVVFVQRVQKMEKALVGVSINSAKR